MSAPRLAWLGWVSAGAAWLAVVAAGLVLALNVADRAAADDFIAEPGRAQVAVAIVSGVVFAVPGVVLIGIGFRRRRRAGDAS